MKEIKCNDCANLAALPCGKNKFIHKCKYYGARLHEIAENSGKSRNIEACRYCIEDHFERFRRKKSQKSG